MAELPAFDTKSAYSIVFVDADAAPGNSDGIPALGPAAVALAAALALLARRRP